jgi:hypothetical protein
MGEQELYSRENLEAFFKWNDKPLKHFLDEMDCEDQAKEFALSNPRAFGYVSFKSKYRGKRYFWIESGEASEIDPMECFLKARELKYSKAKERIHKSLFRRSSYERVKNSYSRGKRQDT